MATTLPVRQQERSVTFAPPLSLPRPVFLEPPLRRLVNIVAAFVGLVAAAPFMIPIAALVRLTSRGPALYTQTRIGIDRRGTGRARGYGRRRSDLGGKPFTILKFRTMRDAPPDVDGQVWASENDVRVTKLGRALRHLRLDELPQLVNVLIGDMNLVGPRPEQPEIFQQLSDEIVDYRRRQRVRPGITGWAQVNRGYDHSVDDVRRKVALDLEYIGRQSAVEDLKIMAKTVPVMLFRKGAC